MTRHVARNNVVMSAGKRSCPDIICYLLSVISFFTREISRVPCLYRVVSISLYTVYTLVSRLSPSGLRVRPSRRRRTAVGADRRERQVHARCSMHFLFQLAQVFEVGRPLKKVEAAPNPRAEARRRRGRREAEARESCSYLVHGASNLR